MTILTDGCVQPELCHPSDNNKQGVHNKEILYLLNEESGFFTYILYTHIYMDNTDHITPAGASACMPWKSIVLYRCHRQTMVAELGKNMNVMSSV